MQDSFCSTGSFHAFFTPTLSLWCVQMMVYISHWNTRKHTHTHTHAGRNTFPLLSAEDGYLGQTLLSVCVRRPLGVFPWWPSHNIIYGKCFIPCHCQHTHKHTHTLWEFDYRSIILISHGNCYDSHLRVHPDTSPNTHTHIHSIHMCAETHEHRDTEPP